MVACTQPELTWRANAREQEKLVALLYGQRSARPGGLFTYIKLTLIEKKASMERISQQSLCCIFYEKLGAFASRVISNSLNLLSGSEAFTQAGSAFLMPRRAPMSGVLTLFQSPATHRLFKTLCQKPSSVAEVQQRHFCRVSLSYLLFHVYDTSFFPRESTFYLQELAA